MIDQRPRSTTTKSYRLQQKGWIAFMVGILICGLIQVFAFAEQHGGWWWVWIVPIQVGAYVVIKAFCSHAFNKEQTTLIYDLEIFLCLLGMIFVWQFGMGAVDALTWVVAIASLLIGGVSLITGILLARR